MQEAPAILPGATLGILGGGQLGRMFAQAAACLGYRVHVFSNHAESPAGQVADQQTIADYEDSRALKEFASSVDVITLEFENVPTSTVETLEVIVSVRPSSRVLHTLQNRLREKRFLQQTGILCTPFAEVTTADQLKQAVEQVGLPAVLKTAEFGYDGKGQVKIDCASEAPTAWADLGNTPAILEGWVKYQQELSVIVARRPSGEMAIHGPIANDHVNHILDVSAFPASELEPFATQAHQIGRSVVEALDLVGVCCIEFFLTSDGQLLVNEIAPRPHNSGHLTIEACATSQFEQQVRAICNLPLGSSESLKPAAMINLLGDLWECGEPSWTAVLADPRVHLHLYGKSAPRAGRKMGHLTVLAQTVEQAAQQARMARAALKS